MIFRFLDWWSCVRKMMNRTVLSCLVGASMLMASVAQAATLQFGTVNVAGPSSTGASCPLPTNLQTSVPANTTLCTITVQPTGWTGAIGNPTGGADSSKFAVVTNPGGVGSVLQNTVPLTSTGSAAGNGQYEVGSSQVTP